MKFFSEETESKAGLLQKLLLLGLVLGVLTALSLVISVAAEASTRRFDPPSVGGTNAAGGGGAADGGRSACFNPNQHLRRNVDPGRDADRASSLQGLIQDWQLSPKNFADGIVTKTFLTSAKKSLLPLGQALPTALISQWSQSGCVGGNVSFGSGSSLVKAKIIEADESKLVLEGGWIFSARSATSVHVERHVSLTHQFKCGLFRSIPESHEVRLSFIVDLESGDAPANHLNLMEETLSSDELNADRNLVCGGGQSQS